MSRIAFDDEQDSVTYLKEQTITSSAKILEMSPPPLPPPPPPPPPRW